MKIAYCGYDFFCNCFEYLLEEKNQIIKVFSMECDNKYNFNEQIKKKSESLHIPFTLEKITLKDIELLQRKGCELIITAGYPYKIPVYDGMPKTINIHPSLLPEGKGPWPLPLIILKDLTESGVSIHKITNQWDAGDILIQDKFEVINSDTLQTISKKSQETAKECLVKAMNNFEYYWQNATPQSEGSYWKMPTWDDRTIDWNSSIEEIDKIIRAFGNFDSFATFDGKDWLVQSAICKKEEHNYASGTIIERKDKEVVVTAKDGFVRITSYSIDPDFEE